MDIVRRLDAAVEDGDGDLPNWRLMADASSVITSLRDTLTRIARVSADKWVHDEAIAAVKISKC